MVGNPFSDADSHMVALFGLVHAGRSVRRHRLRVQRATLALTAGLVATSLAACGGSAMPVEIVTLTPKPVEQTGEFLGTIKSRKSTTVQPQAEGIITHIAVKSGDRVSPGAVILEIDAGPQRSAVAVLEGIHAAREADATFAKQQAARAK